MNKNAFKFLAKLSLVGGLLFYLFKKGFISIDATQRAFEQGNLIWPAFFALAIGTVISLLRWHLLLSAQGIHLGWRRTFQLGLVGIFFNIALPGAVSGDVIKAVYVGRESPGNRGAALGSILFDRVAGVSALVLISATALLFGLHFQWGSALFGAVKAFVSICALCVVVFFGYVFFVRDHKDPLLLLFNRLTQRFEWVGSIARIYQGIKNYQKSQGIVLLSLAMSFFVHLLVVFACICFSHALGETHLPNLALGIVVPLGLVVTAIPIMPGGVGTGHAAFSWLFLQMGSERGADVFNLYLLYQLFAGMVGGLIYLKFKTKVASLSLSTNE